MSKLTNHLRLLLLLIATLIILACGLNTNPLDNLWPASEASPQPTSTAQPYTLGVTSVNNGLSELRSYRASLAVDFTGTRNGQPTAGQIESLTEVTRQPPALHQYLQADMITPTTRIAAGVSEFFRVEDKVYVKRAENGAWLALTNGQVSPETLDFFALERLITLPWAVSNPPRLETLHGLNVQHYTFSETDLIVPNIIFEQAQGDLWLATPGNYLVQYVLSATLRIIIPDPKAHIFDQGQLTLRYTLTDINADFTITPPVDALTAHDTFNHLPRLPDAEVISVFPTLIEYTSAISAISATLFYRDQLSALDWTEDQATIFNEKARLTFSKADQTLTIIITPADERDRIKVVLGLDR